MFLGTENATSARHTNNERRREITGGAKTEPSRLRDNLVIGWVHIIRELDFAHRTQAEGRHAHRHPDDAGFGNRRIEAARRAIFFLEPLRASEDAAEEADILPEDHDAVVAFHHHVHRIPDSLDHRPPHRRQYPICWRCSRRCLGMSL